MLFKYRLIVYMLAAQIILYFLYGQFICGKKQAGVDIEAAIKPVPLMIVRSEGGMGNNMFQYATLLGIAAQSGHKPILPKDKHFEELNELFQLSVPTDATIEDNLDTFIPQYESKTGVQHFINQSKLLAQLNVTLYGFFESYLYFDAVKEDIRNDFRFTNDVQHKVDKFFDDNLGVDHRKTVVGVHVRLTDMVILEKKGWILPPITYFVNAMNYFNMRYENVHFVLVSDDKQWLKRHLLPEAPGAATISTVTKGQIDFAILASCHHVIISRGTFGWWAGWLTSGTTVYYERYHPEGSFAAKYHPIWSYIPNDEYNNWVGMT